MPVFGPMPATGVLASLSDMPDADPLMGLPRTGGWMKLQTLDHVGLAVSDIDRSIEWYQRVLGLERAHREAWGDYPAVLVSGGGGVALFAGGGTPIRPSGFDSLPHVGFRTSGRHYEDARSELRAAGTDFRESDHHIARSIYLLDPDAHLIEITTYDVAR